MKKYIILILYITVIVVLVYELGELATFELSDHPFHSEETRGIIWSLGVIVLGVWSFGMLPLILMMWEENENVKKGE